MKQKAQLKAPPPKADVLDSVRACIVELQSLGKALGKAEQMMLLADQRAVASRKAKADAIADALLAGATAPEPGAASPQERAVADCRNTVTILKGRIAAKDQDLHALQEQLNSVRQVFNEARIADFVKASQSAAELWAGVRMKADAIASALGTEASTILGRFPEPADWHSDPEAKELHAEHSEPKLLSEKLAQFAAQAASRKFQAESAKKQAQIAFDPSATYRVVKSVRLLGRDYAPPERLTRFDMSVEWLAKLHASRHLRIVEDQLQ